MAIWADGDALSPDNMNIQHLSSLTVGSGTTSFNAALVAFNHDMTSGDIAVVIGTGNAAASGLNPQGVEGVASFRHSSGSVALGIALIGNVVMASAVSATEARCGQHGFAFGGAGSVDTMVGTYYSFPTATGTIHELIGVDLHRGVTWSGTTNHAVITDGVVSLVSSTATIPSAVSARGYLYCSDVGALVWVGGSGTSTVIGAA